MHTKLRLLKVASLVAICDRNNIQLRSVTKKSRLGVYQAISGLSAEIQTEISKDAEILIESGNVRYSRKRVFEGEIEDPRSTKRGRGNHLVELESNLKPMDTADDSAIGNIENDDANPENEMNVEQ